MEYEVICVADIKDSKIRQQIIELWIKYYSIPLQEALKRIEYVILAIRHINTDTIIGVSTAKIGLHPVLNKFYYFYGMCINPHYKNRPHIFQKTFEYLNQNHHSSIKGVIAILENQKISDKLLHRYQWEKLNNEIFGARTFCRNFDENPKN